MDSRIERLSSQGSWRNSREINVGNVPYSVRDVFITAPLIAGLNVYLVGGTGEGKTQLANDLAGLFGDSFCYAEGRPDFEPSELLKQLNLDLKGKVSDRELVTLTENVNKALFYVDELNRCPPIVMNYFFNFFDGKLLHQGKVHRLGKDGYAVGFASGNIDDGAYVGISETDRALRDRMHLIVKLDDPQFCTTEEDDGFIFDTKKDPRATAPLSGRDALDDILALNNEFRCREVPAILPALGVYFHKGLDYLETSSRHSKRALDLVWPNGDGIKKDTDESKIMPLSKRAILSAISLSQALAMIAESRGHNVNDSALMFLDSLRFTVPYSGVLAPDFVHNEKSGDVYAAYDAVMERTRREFNERKESLEMGIAFAQHGVKEEPLLDKITTVSETNRWTPVRRYVERLAEKPSSDTGRVDDIRKELGK
ncbi:MAG: AAA family ATPase [Nanoarchaeota archaeon]